VLERMIATLGAERTAGRVGEARVRELLGADANFAEYIGEPLLLGTILDETGTVTAIQVQILRPRVDAGQVADLFSDPQSATVGPKLSSLQQQRMALRGVEHFVRVEQGLAIKAPGFDVLEGWIESLPQGEERDALALELHNPSRNFMADQGGTLRRKYFEYDRAGSGYLDISESSDVLEAPAGFAPTPLSPYEYHVAGVPVFERNFEIVGLGDSKYVPLMFLVIGLILFFALRHWIGVVIPLVVVFGSIMSMIGTAFARGDLLNNLTMMSPNMLTAVGVADAIHLVAAWLLLRSKHDNKRDLIQDVLTRNALPVFLTTVTTAMGFYSLTVSGLGPVRMLGSMAAMGTFMAWALSMTVVPALLSLVPHKARVVAPRATRLQRLFSEQRSTNIVDTIIKRRVAILTVSGALLITAIVGLLRVEVDSDFRGMFPDDNPAMMDYQWTEDRMGGVGDLEIVLRAAKLEKVKPLDAEQEGRLAELNVRKLGSETAPDEFAALSAEESQEFAMLGVQRDAWVLAQIGLSPEFLDALGRFEERLRSEMAEPGSDMAVVTDLISPLDTLRKIHQVQHENAAEYYRLPGGQDVPAELATPDLEYDEWTEEWSYVPGQDASTLVAQYYLQYESGARPGESLWTQLSADRTQFRMQARVVQASSMAHLRAFERIEAITAEFPELQVSGQATKESALADLTLSGKTLLFARTSNLFARGFVESMSLALLAITLLIGLQFRSLRFALVSLIPNVLPIILPLSVFGLLGIPLDGPAILVSSVALGVCVDDTIHFLTKFSRGEKAGLSARDALVHVLQEAGAAMTVTTVVLIIGFSTLLLSDFSPNFQMGALASVMIGLAWIADFVVTTAVLSYIRVPSEAPSTEPSTLAVA
jgi:predicted RND superfamily exporter protein